MHDAFLDFLAKHEANRDLIAYWKGDAAALEPAVAAGVSDPVYSAYRSGQKRGLGLSPRSYVRSPEFGGGRP